MTVGKEIHKAPCVLKPELLLSQVAHAVAVSHNKLGDLHFLRGDLVQARCSYHVALNIRQRAFDKIQSEGGANTQDLLLISWLHWVISQCLGSERRVILVSRWQSLM